jgi:hypothetical protein
MPNCDKPLTNKPISKINNNGIRTFNTETSDQIINNIKNAKDSIFVFRIREIADSNYIKLYKFIIEYIINKKINFHKNYMIKVQHKILINNINKYKLK